MQLPVSDVTATTTRFVVIAVSTPKRLTPSRGYLAAIHSLSLKKRLQKLRLNLTLSLQKKAFARMQTLVAKPGDTKAEQEAYEELP